MSHYTHLTINEREKAMVLFAQGFSLRAAAIKLNRSASTLSREIARNRYKNGNYSASHAEKLCKKRNKLHGQKPKLMSKPLSKYVIDRLCLGWSAEQISGRAKIENALFSVSYATIYRAIDSGVLPKQTRKFMRFKRKNKHHKTTDKRGQIAERVSIHDRPAAVESRTEVGHWESDTIIGQRKTGCFGTHVERALGYLVAFRLDDRKGKSFNNATVDAFLAFRSS